MHPFWTSFAVFCVILCIASWYHWRFLRCVRREFPSLWRDMGGPTGWTEGTLFDALGTYWYLVRRGYQQRGNTDEKRFCEQFRVPMLVTYVAALVSIAVCFFFTGLLIGGKP
jgi:hypothetical protein